VEKVKMRMNMLKNKNREEIIEDTIRNKYASKMEIQKKREHISNALSEMSMMNLGAT
jgi:hypothetical protein